MEAYRDDPHEEDFNELRQAALEDINRSGVRKRMRKAASKAKLPKLGSQADLKAQQGSTGAEDVVKAVMETSGGDNAALARKIHARYDAVGLRQPAVEVRFDDVSLSAYVPAGSTDGLFTVGVDMMVKGLTAIGTVTRQKPPMQEMHILQNVSGVFKPGRICLLVGPPGGGKSMLMKALCRAAPAAMTGSITYNGHTLDEFNTTRTARYVDQHDLHNPLLTVRETLTFSATCQGAGYNRSAHPDPGMLELLEKKEQEMGVEVDENVKELMSGMHHNDDPSHNVALTLQLLSLVNCADTIVGDGMTRGISGGERKRVTTGEMIVGPSKVLFMDEISTGLDSASTFAIVQSLANWAHATDSTIIITLLQPEPQVYDLFDDVMLVANGRIPYQGPRPNVEPFFRDLGFTVPEKTAVADFLQEIVSKKDQARLRTDRNAFESQLDFVPASAFAAKFKESENYKAIREVLDKPFPKERSHPAALMKSRYGITGWEQVKVLTWREQLLLLRNRQGQIYRYIQMGVLSLMISTLLVRGYVTNNDTVGEASNALSAIFFSMAYMQFLGLAETADTIQRLPVFWKQKFALFHAGWAYAVPFGIVRIPITLIEVTAWSGIVYWIVGLETDAGRFFTFWITLILLQLTSASLYRMVGALARSIVLGVSCAVIMMLITFLGSGFVLRRPDIMDWWYWFTWVSPLQYVITGLANNEFNGDSYNVVLEGTDDRLGDIVMDQFGIMKGEKWRWIGPVVLISYYVVFNVINICAFTFLPPPPLPPPAPPPEEPEFVLSKHGDAERAESKSDDVVVDMDGSGEEEITKKALDFPFEPITLTFRDLKYFVPNPAGPGELELLKGITGVFRPGILTALMGASGAGKTTLMDVLADRKTAGRMEGDVRVNGYPKEPTTFARVMGYGEQFDTHSSGATVEEAIRTSALLRLSPDISAEDRAAFVEQTLDIVELTELRGSICGIPGMFGLSGEQFKRLTIAVELAANPAIMFLDEPTSGLDARAAQIVMRVVRNIVNSNRTIVCTIHQPSTEIFLNFDELLLLKRGGRTIFAGELGPDSQYLVDYFQAVPGAKQLQRGYNPATYMLEVSTASEEERLEMDFADKWEREPQSQAIADLVTECEKPQEKGHQLTFDSEYAQGRIVQYKELFVRYLRSYWRNPPFNTTRIILTFITALILGSFYWSLGDKFGTTSDIQNIMGALFVTVMFCGFVNFQMIIPTFFMERPVMWRERASRLYAVFPWVQAMEDVEVPWTAFQVTLLSVIAYFMIHFEYDAGKFFFFLLIMFLAVLTYAYLGMVMVCVTPNLQMGITFGATMLGMWFAFAGFLITLPAMPPWWQWFYYLCPPSWHIYALSVSQLGDKDDVFIEVPYETTLEDGSVVTTDSVSGYIERQFDFRHKLKWLAAAVSFIFVLVLRIVVAVCTKYLHFQKR